MKRIVFVLLSLFCIDAFAAKPKNTYVKVSTSYGKVFIKLYNETPKHRDNFIRIVKKGTLNGTLFHR